jgi:hypothetical protein
MRHTFINILRRDIRIYHNNKNFCIIDMSLSNPNKSNLMHMFFLDRINSKFLYRAYNLTDNKDNMINLNNYSMIEHIFDKFLMFNF